MEKQVSRLSNLIIPAFVQYFQTRWRYSSLIHII